MRTLSIHSKYLISLLLSLSVLFFLSDFNANSDDKNNTRPFHYKAPVSEHVESLWSDIRSEFALDHQVQSALVQAEIRIYLADKKKLYNILKAAAPYLYFIHRETQQRSLPAEIDLLPVIESEFNPNDHSKAGATGLWQIIPGTARELGIKVRGNYDGRRSVIFSTKAALAYLNDLKKCFKGNWYLAISAYNCGQGKIRSALRHRHSNVFWNLKLPAETKVYLPKLLAIAAIVNNPEKYGMKLPPITNQPYFAELEMRKPLPLAKVAKSTGTDLTTLQVLNPDYRREPALPNKHGDYTLLVPVKAAPVLKNQLSGVVVSAKQ